MEFDGEVTITFIEDKRREKRLKKEEEKRRGFKNLLVGLPVEDK